ncbi:MAG: YdaU family protein [Propionivibrio sp.]|nr:YdaU family protein [Propionivibrio sp.]
MNYYEHHIGDYAEATAHLSFIEDAAYSRLIRKYYSTEKPLPADVKAVQRLVGARTKEEKKSVEVVLSEFFFLSDDGWHNARCDAEIAAYLDGEPEREVKKVNEENRLKRHRSERAELFKRLTGAGHHAQWNIGIQELRDLVKRICEDGALQPALQPATPPATAPATPATATQSPDTRHQTPDSKVALSEPELSVGETPAENATRVGGLCKQLRVIGIDAAPHLPVWPDLLKRFTDAQIVAVAEIAKARKPGERLHLHYLVPILNEPPMAPHVGTKRKPAPDNFENRDYGTGGRL